MYSYYSDFSKNGVFFQKVVIVLKKNTSENNITLSLPIKFYKNKSYYVVRNAGSAVCTFL